MLPNTKSRRGLQKRKAEKEERTRLALEAKQQKEARRLALLEEKRIKKELLEKEKAEVQKQKDIAFEEARLLAEVKYQENLDKIKKAQQTIADKIVLNPSEEMRSEMALFCESNNLECNRSVVDFYQTMFKTVDHESVRVGYSIRTGANIKAIYLDDLRWEITKNRSDFWVEWSDVVVDVDYERTIKIVDVDGNSAMFSFLERYCYKGSSPDCDHGYWDQPNPLPVKVNLKKED